MLIILLLALTTVFIITSVVFAAEKKALQTQLEEEIRKAIAEKQHLREWGMQTLKANEQLHEQLNGKLEFVAHKGTFRNCDNCRREYKQKNPWQKYCSRSCNKEAYRERRGLPEPEFLREKRLKQPIIIG